jgi:hypothetical protein
MNEIFKKMGKQRIQLCEQYYLTPDPWKGLVLTQEVEKIRKKKDGTEELVKVEDHWYHPLLSQSLSKYLQLKTTESKDLEDLKNRIEKIEKTISNLVNN